MRRDRRDVSRVHRLSLVLLRLWLEFSDRCGVLRIDTGARASFFWMLKALGMI